MHICIEHENILQPPGQVVIMHYNSSLYERNAFVRDSKDCVSALYLISWLSSCNTLMLLFHPALCYWTEAKHS